MSKGENRIDKAVKAAAEEGKITLPNETFKRTPRQEE